MGPTLRPPRRRSIAADTAARLGRFFGVDPRNWLNLQAASDLWEFERAHGADLARVRRFENAV